VGRPWEWVAGAACGSEPLWAQARLARRDGSSSPKGSQSSDGGTWGPSECREAPAGHLPALTASVDAGAGGERWPPARSCRGRGHVHKERAGSNRNGCPAGRPGAMAPRGAPRWRAARRPREQPRGVHQREHHDHIVLPGARGVGSRQQGSIAKGAASNAGRSNARKCALAARPIYACLRS